MLQLALVNKKNIETLQNGYPNHSYWFILKFISNNFQALDWNVMSCWKTWYVRMFRENFGFQYEFQMFTTYFDCIIVNDAEEKIPSLPNVPIAKCKKNLLW